MPSKKNSMAYYARQLREQGERRIARLREAINTESATNRTKNWARQQIKEISSAIQGTRIVNPKTGKRYKSKTDAKIASQMTRLAKAINKVEPTFNVKGDPFEVTQHQINLASARKASIYTKEETQLFYNVTGKIWQKKGIPKSERNSAILDYYNNIREANGLSPMSLSDVFEYVLQENKKAQALQKVNPKVVSDSVSDIAYQETARADKTDGEKGSPPGIGEAILAAIEESLDNLFVLPNPLDYKV